MNQERVKNLQLKLTDMVIETFPDGIETDEVLLVFARFSKLLLEHEIINTPELVVPEIVEILPEQFKEIQEIRKETPAIDRDDYSLAEKLNRDAEKYTEQLEEKESKGYKPKRKAVAVEEFADIRKLDSDDFF